MDPKAFGVTYATGEDLRSTWEDVPVRCGVLCAYEFLIFVGNMASFLSVRSALLQHVNLRAAGLLRLMGREATSIAVRACVGEHFNEPAT